MISEKSEHLFGSGPLNTGKQTSRDRVTYDDRLNHILEAATAEIARMGYQKASMRAVAQAADVSLAGIYHYFDSKEKMLFLIQFRTFSSLLNNLREKLHGLDDPVEQLRVMVRAHVSYFAANMPALKVCSHELESLSSDAYDETRRIRREYYEATRSIIERILKKHAPAAQPDLHATTMVLFGSLNWLYRWYHPKRGRSPNALASQMAEQFLSGLLGASKMSAAARGDFARGEADDFGSAGG